MNDKVLRLKYIRVLEKFAKRTISLLKLNDFDFEQFKIKTLRNYEEVKKAEKVRLNSAYLVSLKNYTELILKTITHHSKTFEAEKNLLLKEANLLHKEKNRNNYKKDKHKHSKFNDGY